MKTPVLDLFASLICPMNAYSQDEPVLNLEVNSRFDFIGLINHDNKNMSLPAKGGQSARSFQ